MPVYVDPLQTCKPTGRWKWCQVSHLTADSTEELVAFATQKLGLRREWLQDPAMMRCSQMHFDLTENKRAQAVRMGAIELTREQAVERMRLARESRAAAGSGLFARGRML